MTRDLKEPSHSGDYRYLYTKECIEWWLTGLVVE